MTIINNGSSGPVVNTTNAVTSPGASPTISTVQGGAPVSIKKGLRVNLSEMLQGVQAVLPDGSALTTKDGAVPKATLVTELQQALDLYVTIDGQVQALKTSRTQLSAGEEAARALLLVLRQALKNLLGVDSPQLASFGMKPAAQAKVRTTAQKAASAVKAKQTRLLRNTKSKQAKAGTKFAGDVQLSVSAAGNVSSTAQPATVSTAAPVANVAAPAVVTPVVKPAS